MKLHPHYKFLGIQDNSIPVITPTVESVPQHLPFFMGLAAWGTTHATYNDGSLFTRRYHEKTLAPRSKWNNITTPFIEGCLGAPNPIFFKRLEMPNSATSGLTIAFDVLETELPLYEVDDNGNFIITAEGDMVPTGDTAIGLSIIPMVTALDFASMGDGTRVPGTQTANGVTSEIYKIKDLPARYFGELGNGIGVRISSPRNTSVSSVDVDLMESQKAYIHSLEIVLQEDLRTAPVPWTTFFGARSVDFSLKPGAYNPLTGQDLYLPLRYDSQYVNEDYDVDGPFKDIVTYQDNIDMLLEKMQTVESAVNPRVSADPEDMYLMNLFQASDVDGIPYQAIVMGDSLNNYPEFTEINTHYLVGGSDGDMTRDNFEAEVERQLSNFGSLDDKFKDIARFPFSTFYDVGFGMPVKRAMSNLMSARSDVDIVSAPFIADASPMTISEEISIAIALRAHYRLVPESTVYGTATCRAVIMGQQARIANSTWTKTVPTTYELMMKRAKYMGAEDGYRKNEFLYTTHPRNRIEYLRNKDISDTWAEDNVRNVQWVTGLVNISSSGMSENFFPAIQTIYDSSESILNSERIMTITGVIKRYAFRIWTELVGNDELTEKQFIERSNQRIIEMCLNRFGKNILIRPETYMSTDGGKATWNTRIHLGAPHQKLANNITVVSHSYEDLLAASI